MKIKGNILVRSAACILAAALMVPAGTVLADEAQGPGPELLVSDYDTVELKEVEEGKEHKEHKEIRSDDTSAEESGSAEQAPVPEDEADAAEVDLHFHVIVIDEAQEPGYFHTGLTQGSHCSECGDVIAAQQVIPARAYSEDLGYGSSGPDVYELQEALAELGFLTTEYSGYFGDATMEALTVMRMRRNFLLIRTMKTMSSMTLFPLA